MVLVALEVGLLAAVVYVASVCVYRLCFHPLAKYPGPLLCALTDWYPAYFAWKGEWVEAQAGWREKYGEIVRHGPNSVTFFGLSAMTQIYGVRSNVSKTEGYATLSASRTPNLISAIDKSVHGFKRRVISQTMTEESLKSMETRIVSHIQRFVALLGKNGDGASNSAELKGWTAPKTFRMRADWLTFDVMSDLTYGKPLGLLESEELRWLPTIFRKISQVTAASLIQPNLFRYKLDRLLLASRRKAFRETGTWLSKRAYERADKGDDVEEKDMFYAMMHAVDPKTNKSFNRKDMWTESVLLLFSGSDTTSSTMSAVLFYLLHNPSWLARAAKEVRSAFSSSDDILLNSTLSSCKELLACIDETQRLAPTAPNGPPRVADAGGITVDGHYLPQGTIVNSPIYHLQRQEAFFASPNDFQPDRWLVNEATATEDEARIKHQQKAFMPFHIGPRSCTGWRLARMELEITLARILFLYDIKLASSSPCCAKTAAGESCQFKMKSWMVATVDGPVVQFRPRNLEVE